MIIKRSQITQILDIIENKKNERFDINTQYKMLLIKKKIKEDLELIEEQYQLLLDTYGEKDEQGLLIKTKDGGIKIKEDYQKECQEKVSEFNKLNVSMPDVYFTIEELEALNLTLFELEILEPFIKI